MSLTNCATGFGFSPAVYIGLLTVFGLMILLFWLVTRAGFPGRQHFAATVGAMSVWLALAVIEIAVESLDCKIAVASATWPAISITPIAWCLFMWHFCLEPSPGLNRKVIAIGALLVVVISAAALTNPLHGLFYGPETRIVSDGASSYARFDHGPVFYLAAATLYVFLSTALWIAALACIKSSQLMRPLMMSLLLATIAPMSANIMYIATGATIFGFDPTPFAFAFVLMALAPIIVSPRGFDAAAAARDLLFFNTPDPVFVVDRYGAITNVNPAAQGLLNDPALSQSAEPFEWLPSPEQSTNTETPSRSLSLGDRDFRLRTLPIYRPLNESEERAGSITILSDFTELNREKERFEIIAETVGDVIWDYNIETGQWWATPHWDEKLGVKLDEPDTSPDQWLRFVSEEDRPRHVASLVSALRSDRDIWREETRLTGTDGKVINIQINAKLLRRDDGRAYRALGSLKNIDQEKQLSDLVAHTRGLEAVSQMTGGIAHDFNNLLMIILGNTEILEMSQLEGEDRESIELISRAATSASQLTKRLLQFAGKSDLKTKTIDPSDFLEDLLPLIRSSLTNEISVCATVARDTWPIKTDPSALEQCLLNLALNARDAMPQGGKLDIRIENTIIPAAALGSASDLEPGKYILISVSDNGEGMAAEVLAKAREPFFTTKEIGKGTGLGLSTAFGFARQTGGSIELRSEKGSGTRVQVWLPAADPADGDEQGNQAAHRSEKAFSSHDGRGRSVLLVEDQKEIRNHLSRVLSKSGYKVTVAQDGPTALEQLEASEPFDLLFTDIIMPGGINGLELFRKATEIAPGMKVLLSSGFYGNTLEETDALSGTNAHILAKPYKMAELFEALDHAFEGD